MIKATTTKATKTKGKPRAKAYSYLRFSSPEQQKGDSFARQTRMALEYAARHGLELDESLTFQDLGVSAYRGLNAEAGRLADFLEAVREGLVPRGSYLLVEALDRLSRLTPRKAMRVLEDIVEEGITLVTLNDGREYTVETLNDDPTSLLIAIVLFMRANEESATKSRRLTSAWEGKRARISDKALTSRTPAWIRLNKETGALELIPERAEIVRRIFDLYAKGVGHNLIAGTLNREGVPCFGSAAHWHRTYIKKILNNESVVGTIIPHRYIYQDGRNVRVPLEPVTGYYPPVIDGATFADAQKRGESPAKQRTGSLANVLAGLAKCPQCGHTMTRVQKGDPNKGGVPKMVCTRAKAGAGCVYKSVPYHQVEDAIYANTSYLVGTAPSGKPGLDDELSQLETHLEVTRAAIDNLLTDLATAPSRIISQRVRELEVSMDQTQARRDELLDELLAASGPVLMKRLRELEAALEVNPRDTARANAALRLVISSVVIDYDRGQLDFTWKHGGESSIVYAMPAQEAAE
ncbi:recombinase family protein [Pseudomonas mediterranea]|uniref:recombinase family protein n=1 Tax=Pseudomonas mediterranea TaxID=183795 RepID=UPI0009EA619E|nr:recombinase family protein [Pseudomonas mediterranea]